MNKKTCQSKLVGILKKAGTLYLMLSMILSLSLAISPVEASAAAKWPTRSDAKAFMDRNMGKWMNGGLGQCVELYNQYVKQVCGQTPVSCDYAYQIYDRKQPQGWEKIDPNDINKHGGYKVGDIVVYGPGNGSDVGKAGHVALVYSVSNGRVVKLFEQYWYDKWGNLHREAALYDFHSKRLKGDRKSVV